MPTASGKKVEQVKLSKHAAERALQNVVIFGDTDIFPFPFELNAIREDPEGFAELLVEMSVDFEQTITDYPVEHFSTLSPTGYAGFRWATQIDPVWNAYFLACVLELSPTIEQMRLPVDAKRVFSYRLTTTDDRIFAEGGWRQFQEQCRNLSEDHKYVVSVDIADFYSRIYHHRIENALRVADPDGVRTKQIMAILGNLSNVFGTRFE